MDKAETILDLVVKRAGANMKQYKRKGQIEKYWLDDQCRGELKLEKFYKLSEKGIMTIVELNTGRG
jgi:hypothetical protein